MVNGVKAYEHITKEAINRHEVFTTNITKYATGAIGTPVAIAHSEKGVECEHCGKHEQYVIYSYETVMYSVCTACNTEYCNTDWYSIMTTRLQERIASAIESYRKVFYDEKTVATRKQASVAAYRKTRERNRTRCFFD